MEKLYQLESLCPCVREVGLQLHDSWRLRPRMIYDHEILYCFRGSATIKIYGEEHLIAEGDLVVIPPDTPHFFWVDESRDSELYWLHCDFEYREDSNWIYKYYNTPELYARLFSSKLLEREHVRPKALFFDGKPLPLRVSFADTSEVYILFHTLYNLYNRRDEQFPIESKILMLRMLKEIFAAQGYFNPTANSNNERISRMIKNYIKTNYFRKLNVKEICACTHLNPEYAGKVFRKMNGVSVIDFLNRHRIDVAKKLLLDTDLSIADVSDMVGFQNETYFSKVTKKVTGMTPAHLRLHMLSLLDGLAETDK